MEIPFEYLALAVIVISALVWVIAKHKTALLLAVSGAYILFVYIVGSRLDLGGWWFFVTMIGGALLLRYIVNKRKL
jgi:hypothetical protein